MTFTRVQLEAFEDQMLAIYSHRSMESKGRVYPEQEPSNRTAFQRDRDRILHTTAFRRLEYKTQVFINYEGDYYRTRLTHTLEVAQIGRTIARAMGVNQDLVEAICLAHDLGHPAFGHSGESALTRLMKDSGGFNHNLQSMRIVTLLEHRFAEFPGLNLTWEVREGLVKHETEFISSTSSEYNPELRGHLEAQIADKADEIAYSAHDLDDGLRSGMITPKMLEGITIWEILAGEIGWNGGVLDELDRHRLIRELIGLLVNDLLENTTRTILDNKIKTINQLQELSFNVANFSEDMHRRNRQLKDFLYKNLYRHYRIVRMTNKAERTITDLFKAYQSDPSMLPWKVQEKIDLYGLERTICDYLSGMTDRYAIEEHKKLFDPSIVT